MKFSEGIRNIFANLLSRIGFRKHGTVYLNLLTLLIAAAVTAYFVFGAFRGVDIPYRTVQAVEYEAGVGTTAHGCVVRTETVLRSHAAFTEPSVSEGQKIGAGQQVAVGYTTESARQRQQEIVRLEQSVALLDYAGTSLSDTFDQITADAEIRERLLDYAALVQGSDLSEAQARSASLKGMVLRRSISENDLAAIRYQADAARRTLDELQKQANADTVAVYADRTGYYSAETDGYEAVLTPESLTALSPAQLASMRPEALPDRAAGRIVTGESWYYAAAVPEQTAAELKSGSKVTLTFTQRPAKSYEMTVDFVGQAEAGQCVLSLRCARYVQDVTDLRWADADIILRTYSGLRVPKEAVRVREDHTVGVYILESARVKWKPITILHDNGESYLVALDRTSTDHLWPGDEILISSMELEEGKVVS